MIISERDANWAADEFIQYFSQMSNIEDYLRFVKKEVIASTSSLVSLDEEFFNADMHPEDMDFDIKFVGSRFQNAVPQEHYVNLLRAVSSHNNESNIPGRELRWMIYEKNTKKVLGFIRFGSPTINSKPRNEWLGKSPDLTIFNRHAAMGFVIVPSQPFGYNYLGGKLCAAVCVSHEVREIVNKKYGMNMCLFETTSLYGSTKGVSQYDGMKPYIRYDGLTDSDFIPMMHGKPYEDLRDFVQNIVGDIVDEDVSSKKLKTTMKIISLVKAALKNTPEGDTFIATIEKAKGLTEQKRYYHSDYGFNNMKDYVNCKTDVLIPGENFEKHKLVNLIEWWRNKAINRYTTLHNEGRLRTELEIWTSGKDIQIIR